MLLDSSDEDLPVRKKWVRFEPTITIGNIISSIFLISVLIGWGVRIELAQRSLEVRVAGDEKEFSAELANIRNTQVANLEQLKDLIASQGERSQEQLTSLITGLRRLDDKITLLGFGRSPIAQPEQP